MRAEIHIGGSRALPGQRRDRSARRTNATTRHAGNLLDLGADNLLQPTGPSCERTRNQRLELPKRSLRVPP